MTNVNRDVKIKRHNLVGRKYTFRDLATPKDVKMPPLIRAGWAFATDAPITKFSVDKDNAD